MTGKSHLLTSVGSAVVGTNILLATVAYAPEKISTIANKVLHFLAGTDSGLPIAVYAGISIVYFLFASVLPDIDKDTSMVSKLLHFHLKIEHHTWTHTLWALLLIVPLIAFRPFVFLFLGYFCHLFWDSFSACGNAWLYPITKYRRYGENAKVKNGHKLKLYYTGQASEYVVLGSFLTVVVFMCIWFVHDGIYARALNIVGQIF